MVDIKNEKWNRIQLGNDFLVICVSKIEPKFDKFLKHKQEQPEFFCSVGNTLGFYFYLAHACDPRVRICDPLGVANQRVKKKNFKHKTNNPVIF